MKNITSLPQTGFAPNNKAIAAHLRQQAEWIEAGDAAPIRNVVLVIEYADGDLRRQTMGAPCDLARVTGLLVMAATRASVGDQS